MWLAAFSSSSVSQKTVPSGPMRPLAVDERELAEPRRAVVLGRERRAARRRRGRRRSARPGRLRTRRGSRRSSRRRPRAGASRVTWPSTRVGSGVVNISSLGMFGKWRSPSTVAKSAACHADERKQADRQVGARAVEPDRVEAPLGEPVAATLSSVARALAPGARPGRPRRAGRRARSRPRAGRTPPPASRSG